MEWFAALDVHNGRQVETAKQHGHTDANEDLSSKVEDKRRKKGTVDLMILCSDESAVTAVSDMYCLPSLPPEVHIGSPLELKLHLGGKPSVTVCAIGLLASDLKETALTNASKWENSDFADLLKTARAAAEKKTIVVICVDRNVEKLTLSQSEEIQITEKIEVILEEKGVILWWRGRIQEPAPRDIGAAALPARQQGGQPTMEWIELKDDPQTAISEKTLLLKTSIRYGVISYKEDDVKTMKEGWVIPSILVSDLLSKWKNVHKAELEIYSENESGDLRTVVKEIPRSILKSSIEACIKVAQLFYRK